MDLAELRLYGDTPSSAYRSKSVDPLAKNKRKLAVSNAALRGAGEGVSGVRDPNRFIEESLN